MGTLSILNTYEGDIRISFDTNNTAEAIRAKRVIKDMIRRGYALLIEVDGAYQRAVDFDEKIGVYIIADFDPSQTIPENQTATDTEGESVGQEQTPESPKPKIKKSTKRRKIGMEIANAVAIPRSAGG